MHTAPVSPGNTAGSIHQSSPRVPRATSHALHEHLAKPAPALHLRLQPPACMHQRQLPVDSSNRPTMVLGRAHTIRRRLRRE